MDRPKALSPIEAHEIIQRLLDLHDTLSFSSHARDRMRQRHFTVDDTHLVLHRGTISPTPVWDDQFQNWQYRISGRDCDNVPLVLIVALEPELGRITVITGEDD
jgi:hypothetical protein